MEIREKSADFFLAFSNQAIAKHSLHFYHPNAKGAKNDIFVSLLKIVKWKRGSAQARNDKRHNFRQKFPFKERGQRSRKGAFDFREIRKIEDPLEVETLKRLILFYAIVYIQSKCQLMSLVKHNLQTKTR